MMLKFTHVTIVNALKCELQMGQGQILRLDNYVP